MFAGRKIIVVGHRNGCRSRRGTPPGRRQTTLSTGIVATVFAAVGRGRRVRISIVERDSGGVNVGRRVFVYDVTVLYVIALTRIQYVFTKVVVMVLLTGMINIKL